jgi:hypothetical protein
MRRLEGEEKDIEMAGQTKSSIVEALVLDFENRTKRSLDIWDKRAKIEAIKIPGHRENVDKGFDNNWLKMSRYKALKLLAVYRLLIRPGKFTKTSALQSSIRFQF